MRRLAIFAGRGMSRDGDLTGAASGAMTEAMVAVLSGRWRGDMGTAAGTEWVMRLLTTRDTWLPILATGMSG